MNISIHKELINNNLWDKLNKWAIKEGKSLRQKLDEIIHDEINHKELNEIIHNLKEKK